MNLLVASFVHLGWNFYDPPWYEKHCAGILVGIGGLTSAWLAGSKPLRGGDYLSNQARVCLAVLGATIIGLSLWGLWLDKP